MDVFTMIGVIIISVLIIIYLGTLFMLYWNQNPQGTTGGTSGQVPSQVTYTKLGHQGDMGNQMFELACIIAAGKRSGAQVVFPSRLNSLPLRDLCDLSEFTCQDIIPDAIYHEYDNYENIIIPNDGRNYEVRGYRQGYRYFEEIAPEIRRIFTPREAILNQVRAIVPDKYIAIHIRKGDYIKPMHAIPLLREFKQCQLAYYQAGIRLLRKTYPDLPLLVCTDSPQWVTPLLSELDPKAVLAPVPNGLSSKPTELAQVGSKISPKFSDFCTLYLAEALVTCNSTYSWWAGYLRNNRMIIVPSPWWDPAGFLGTAMGLDGPYLHYPEWIVLDADTGHVPINTKHDTDHETLGLYKLLRGLVL